MPERVAPVARQSVEICWPERAASGVCPHSKNGTAGHGKAVIRGVLRLEVRAVVRPSVVHFEFRPVPNQELSVVPEFVVGITAGAANIRTPERARPVTKALSVVVVLGVEVVSARAGFETQPDAVPFEKRLILQPGRCAYRSAPDDPVLVDAVTKVDSCG